MRRKGIGGITVAKSPSSRVQRGVSLLEVLIAIVVFSIGILGLALMQLKGASFTKQAGSRSSVIMATRGLTDAMRGNTASSQIVTSPPANPAAPTATECPYCYNGTDTLTATDCSTNSCTPAQVATNDVKAWIDQLAATAPTATTGIRGTIAWSPILGTYVITASWYDGGIKKDSTSEGDQTYIFNYLP
jgi:type IV pilus assembly protein PilV